jgi:hypothetical protein
MVSRDNDTTCTTSLAISILRLCPGDNLKDVSALHRCTSIGGFETGHALHLASSPKNFSVTPISGLPVLFVARPFVRKTHEI